MVGGQGCVKALSVRRDSIFFRLVVRQRPSRNVENVVILSSSLDLHINYQRPLGISPQNHCAAGVSKGCDWATALLDAITRNGDVSGYQQRSFDLSVGLEHG